MSGYFKTKIVILAGGSGTRFWPLSRFSCPKQFLSLTGKSSLIFETAKRFEKIATKEDFLVVTNSEHTELVNEHLGSVSVLAEPIGRNTAASIGWAAIKFRKRGQDPVNVVLPADHTIADNDAFLRVINEGIELAATKDLLVTLGIKPTFAHTGYGYIKSADRISGNVFFVERFAEKPDKIQAEKYLAAGNYFWNSGMFIWRSSVILAAIEKLMPELYQGLLKIEAATGTEEEERVVRTVFPRLPAQSIDYGVLEKAANMAVVAAADFGWSDVGSWDQWAAALPADKAGNVVRGDSILVDSEDCIVYSQGKSAVLLGAKDLVLINVADVVFVCPRHALQDVKKVVEELRQHGRLDLI